ncbi:uncharacterized protein SPAPADRAFT_60036 [Spathaspora passalidarum NRRL Y-27907]|uniref:Aminotransferase class I/classII large domain-containing protein n=1 Tax=Spathaspora passalidarum (strain NRRL Y-27907 / 11-Y1) TaxID=619300 RepID=G3AJE5_SPAPN|nr:uncharacterized protein SPAPADRAFT_60036 [Spathaspora passalidarum NRRL Y-27907]EGW34604.1 hypothetical protein SPAPADRAFT_60036 [Spathaspora passalidarum NRRL Y-27907]
MVKQEDFAVEQFMDKYETKIKYNMAETCVDSLSFNQLFGLIAGDSNVKVLTEKILNTKLTYGHIRGSPELKQAIANIYSSDGGSITPEDIVITNGAIGANFLTLYSLVDADDKVIVVNPTYQQLSSVSQAFSGKAENIISWDLNFENHYLPDLDQLKELVAKHSPKLLIINNPNNPTGVVWGDDIMKQIVKICSQSDMYLLCDEVYRPLYHSISDNIPKSVVSYGYTKTISTSSTSKAFSLAGLRLGWIVTKDSNVINGLYSKRDYNTISVSIIDDLLATVALENYKTILKRSYEICTTNLQILQDYIDNTDLLSWVRPKGGSTCFIKVNIEGIDTMKMCVELVEQFETLVVPGEVFDNKRGYIRVGFGNSSDDIKQGLGQLTKYFKSNGYLS